jgi:hypothetical protein
MDIDDDKLLETLGKIIKSELGKDYSKYDLKNLLKLTELMMDIASDEFRCNSCKETFRIYGIIR